jgi:hypothetical protein
MAEINLDFPEINQTTPAEKEREWLKSKIGYFSASDLHRLMTNGTKGREWGDTAITYLYSVERQRWINKPPNEVSAAPMRWGNEQEAYAVEWLRANNDTGLDIRHYESDFDYKPFIKVDWARFGVSPDADYFDPKKQQIKGIIEIKSVWGEKDTSMFFSPSRPYEKKRSDGFIMHKEQLAGLMLAFPYINDIFLVKYDGQTDSEFDIRSVTDPDRGIIFHFSREEFGTYLDEVKERIIKADKYLDLGYDLEFINDYYSKK